MDQFWNNFRFFFRGGARTVGEDEITEIRQSLILAILISSLLAVALIQYLARGGFPR
jgi:hypothetical protein